MTPISVGGAPSIPSTARWTGREIVLWSALTVALSASWVDLARHGAAEPWARPSALFVLLFVGLAGSGPAGPGAWRSGALLVAAGLGLSLVASGGGLARLGRLGIPLGMIGMARALGRPSFAGSLLALWAVPLPFAFSRALSPGLEQALAALAVRVAQAGGLAAERGLHSLEIAGATLALAPPDGGLPLAFYLAGVGWWSAVRAGGGLRAAALAALRLAPVGFVAQAVALAGAFALLASGAAGAARALLDWCAWPVLLLALARVAARPRSSAPRP